MIPDFLLHLIVDEIHAQDELRGVRVGYQGICESRMLHDGDPSSPNYHHVIVILEEVGNPLPTQGPTEPTSGGSAPSPLALTAPSPVITNDSRVGSELIGAGLSCGVAVVSGIVMIGGVAAEVPSAGTSTILVVAGWIGFATSSVACVNGIVRSTEALIDGEDNSLQRWDSDPVYGTLFLINDALGIVSGVASLPSAARNVVRLLRLRGGLPAEEALLQMNRFQRQRAVQQALREASRNDAAEITQALREAGLDQNQLSRLIDDGVLTRSMRASGPAQRLVAGAMSQGTATALNAAIRDIVVTGTGFTGSALPSYITGSASGSVNALIVNVVGVE